MKKKQGQISVFQLFCLLYSSRMVGTFIYLFRLRGYMESGDRIASAFTYLLFSVLFAVPALICIKQQPNADILTQTEVISPSFSRITAALDAIVFLWGCILTVSRFGLFASSVLLLQKNLLLFIFILLSAAVFCASKGLEPLARTGVIFTFILVSSLCFSSSTLLADFDIDNLSRPFQNGAQDVINESFFAACRNIETTALLFIYPDVNGKVKKAFFGWILSFSVSVASFFALVGGVMGHYGDLQMFPLHTLSVLAQAPVAERMDDLLNGIWVVCVMIKIAFLLYVFRNIIAHIFKKDLQTLPLLFGGAATYAGYLVLSRTIDGFAKTLLFPGNWLGYLLVTVLIPCCIFIFGKHKKNKTKRVTK